MERMGKILLLEGELIVPFRYATFLSEANRFHWVGKSRNSCATIVRSFSREISLTARQTEAILPAGELHTISQAAEN